MQLAVWARGNVVELRLPGSRPLTAGQLRLVREAQARHGAAVRITHDAVQVAPKVCLNFYCDPPLRAGIRGHGGFGPCTLSFLARSRSDGKLYIMTAGHCTASKGEPWWTYFPDGSDHDIGPVHNRINSVAYGDMAVIRVVNEAGWQARAWVLVLASGSTTYNDHYRITRDDYAVEGNRVCATGITSLTRCGILRRAVIPNEAGRMEATFCTRGGDSGGPVYASNTAYGIIVAGTDPANRRACPTSRTSATPRRT